jgi:hypothetical protein
MRTRKAFFPPPIRSIGLSKHSNMIAPTGLPSDQIREVLFHYARRVLLVEVSSWALPIPAERYRSGNGSSLPIGLPSQIARPFSYVRMRPALPGNGGADFGGIQLASSFLRAAWAATFARLVHSRGSFTVS